MGKTLYFRLSTSIAILLSAFLAAPASEDGIKGEPARTIDEQGECDEEVEHGTLCGEALAGAIGDEQCAQCDRNKQQGQKAGVKSKDPGDGSQRGDKSNHDGKNMRHGQSDASHGFDEVHRLLMPEILPREDGLIPCMNVKQCEASANTQGSGSNGCQGGDWW